MRITEKAMKDAGKKAEASGLAVTLRGQDPSGFAVRVSPKGRRAYFLRERAGERDTAHKIKATDLTQARALAREILATLDGSKPITVGELCTRHLVEHIEPTCSVKQARSRAGRLRNWIVPLLGEYQASKITPTQISKAKNAVATWSNKKPGHRLRGGEGEANKVVKAVSEAFNWGQRMEIVSRNPAQHVTRFPSVTTDRIFTPDEMQAIRKEIDASEQRKERTTGYMNPSLCRYFRFLMITGWRLSMARDLRWEYLDLPSRMLTWPKGKKKKKAQHTMPIHETAAAYLEALGPKASWVVFSNTNGKQQTNIDRAFQGLKKRAGITNAGTHVFRHTVVTTLISNGVSKEIASLFVGHTDPASANRYAHLEKATNQKAMAARVADALKL